jgi:hypothetical protein
LAAKNIGIGDNRWICGAAAQSDGATVCDALATGGQRSASTKSQARQGIRVYGRSLVSEVEETR